ncbi:MAG: heparan N-sulfatase, partial [Verrucomicrobiota bacterium]
TKKFAYIFNPWSDGTRKWKTATMGTASYRAMNRLAKTDETIAARLHLFDHRVLEEFYDVEKDPDMLTNLIGNPEYKAEIERHRSLLHQWMTGSKDPLIEAFEKRDDPDFLKTWMTRLDDESAARKKNKPKKNPKNKPPKKGKKKA